MDRDPDFFVLITIQYKGRGEPRFLDFFASNTLTESTVFGLLHLLHHLRDNVYRSTLEGCELLLNEHVFDILSGFGDNETKMVPSRLRCKSLDNRDTPSMAQLNEIDKRICFSRVEVYEAIWDSETELGNTLQLCVGAGELCKEVVFGIRYK